MPFGSFFLVLAFVCFIGAMPTWVYNRNWGLFPCAGIALFLLVLVVHQLAKRL